MGNKKSKTQSTQPVAKPPTPPNRPPSPPHTHMMMGCPPPPMNYQPEAKPPTPPTPPNRPPSPPHTHMMMGCPPPPMNYQPVAMPPPPLVVGGIERLKDMEVLDRIIVPDYVVGGVKLYYQLLLDMKELSKGVNEEDINDVVYSPIC
eukprot:TRINITY_DN568_c0_g1_i3.p1 TRINITY_DN568_c0_g1~~TRINITY_DN568_c0_g1_i3.p1  ORF type:complete len:147 (-),score=48.99 TRINITY_DN568_c0_g1_i3:850-1290(-)